MAPIYPTGIPASVLPATSDQNAIRQAEIDYVMHEKARWALRLKFDLTTVMQRAKRGEPESKFFGTFDPRVIPPRNYQNCPELYIWEQWCGFKNNVKAGREVVPEDAMDLQPSDWVLHIVNTPVALPKKTVNHRDPSPLDYNETPTSAQVEASNEQNDRKRAAEPDKAIEQASKFPRLNNDTQSRKTHSATTSSRARQSSKTIGLRTTPAPVKNFANRDTSSKVAQKFNHKPQPSGASQPGTSSSITSSAIIPAGDERVPPRWYRDMPDHSRRDGDYQRTIKHYRLSDVIQDFVHKRPTYAIALEELRYRIHKWEVLYVYYPEVLKDQRLLDNWLGLPSIFDDRYNTYKTEFPWDVKADAESLYNRWCSGRLNPDLLHSLAKGEKKGTFTINDGLQKDASYHGQGALINGQWWPRLICAVRDGAHGLHIGGIFGNIHSGAYSLVMSGKKYSGRDRDFGDIVWYYSTDQKNNNKTDLTRPTEVLRKSIGSGRPMRLIRSSTMPDKQYKPVKGFRYDGLYDVVEGKEVDKDKGAWEFKLVRRSGQLPLRAGKGPEARPTDCEQGEWGIYRVALGWDKPKWDDE